MVPACVYLKTDALGKAAEALTQKKIQQLKDADQFERWPRGQTVARYDGGIA